MQASGHSSPDSAPDQANEDHTPGAHTIGDRGTGDRAPRAHATGNRPTRAHGTGNCANQNQSYGERIKPVWVFPWGYRESFIIAAAILLVGFALEWVTPGEGLSAPSWPWNGVTGAILLIIPLMLHLSIPKNRIVMWLGRIPASLGAIAAVTFSVLLMGLFLQGSPSGIAWVDRLGLTRMTTSWPFLMSITWFLFVLGMTTVRRSIPLKGKNIGFLLNHLGLWIVIAGGILGSGDLQRVTMTLQEGQTVWYGTDRQGNTVELPLALELQRFHMEEYPPKMGILHHESESLIIRNERDLVEVEAGKRGEMSGWEFHIREFYRESGRIADRYEPVRDFGAAPAALVEAVHPVDGDTISGWISCGSFAMEHRFLRLDDEHSVAMTVPQSKRYMSIARLYTESGDNRVIDIEVNEPYKAEGWNLYQYSYDDRYGKWSPTSVIEAVRDPWLPLVYTGFVMLLLGAGYIFWVGKEKAEEMEIEEKQIEGMEIGGKQIEDKQHADRREPPAPDRTGEQPETSGPSTVRTEREVYEC